MRLQTLFYVLKVQKPADLKDGLERGESIGNAMNFTRDLANEPPNILHPTEMANRAKKMAKEYWLEMRNS